MRYEAKLIEQNNGYPDVGAFVPGGGDLYRVVDCGPGTINTDDSRGNYFYGVVEDADWGDCPEGDVFLAKVEILRTILSSADLQRLIAEDTRATEGVFRYLRERGIEHTGSITGATLAAVCGVNSRTWRKWIGGERGMPTAAWRLLVEVSGVDVAGQLEAGS